MSVIVLILWFLYPAEDGTVKEGAPIVVNVFSNLQECEDLLTKMVKTSDFKVRGRCDENW